MIDAHCHLQDPRLGERIPEILAGAAAEGIITFAVNGASEADWESVARLAREFPRLVIPFFGLHPWFVRDRSRDWKSKLAAYLDEFTGAGVGEIGLDRWIRDHCIEEQKPVFLAQWELAMEKRRPIAVHCLQAWGPLVECLENQPAHRWLLHSYSGSVEMVPGFVRKGAYFSLSGYFFREEKAGKRDVFLAIPLERWLIETDAPDMALPSTLDRYAGSPFNHPFNLGVIYRQAARLAGIPDSEKFAVQISANFRRFYGGTECSQAADSSSE